VAGLGELQTPVEVARLIARVIARPASAEMTAFIAVAILWPSAHGLCPVGALSTGGKAELNRRFAARRQDAFDTEPWLRDGATAREPEWGSVGGLAGPPGRIAGLTLGELPASVTRPVPPVLSG